LKEKRDRGGGALDRDIIVVRQQPEHFPAALVDVANDTSHQASSWFPSDAASCDPRFAPFSSYSSDMI
jgi:hypothetical protein